MFLAFIGRMREGEEGRSRGGRKRRRGLERDGRKQTKCISDKDLFQRENTEKGEKIEKDEHSHGYICNTSNQ